MSSLKINTFIPQISPIYWILIVVLFTIFLLVSIETLASSHSISQAGNSHNNNENPINW